MLGRFSLTVEHHELPLPYTQKARALLAFLLLHAGCEVSRETLIETFWPNVDPERARNSLNTALHAVRQCFRQARLDPNAFMIATRFVVRWIADNDVDVAALLTLHNSPSVDCLRKALAAYCGEFLPGCYEEWSVEQREHIALAYEHALTIAVRDFADADAARALLNLNPYEESAYILLLEPSQHTAPSRTTMNLAMRCRAMFAEGGIKPCPQLQRTLDDLSGFPPPAPGRDFSHRLASRSTMTR